ncbi:MAG: hypothetical protein ACR2P6_01425 [Gammaproteobacteria bacterium]
MVNTIKISILIAGLALFSVACTGLKNVEKDHGKAVAEMKSKQTLDPVAAVAPDPDAIDATDGQRIEGVMETYRAEGAERPVEAADKISTFDTSN